MENMVNNSFWKNKSVFVTGDSGFKGSWMCHVLALMGAKVTGYSLSPKALSLFKIASIDKEIKHIDGDIRDLKKLMYEFERAEPEIVFHLAAQPLVKSSYEMPQYTYETNVMGTVNILECVRLADGVRSFVNVTTDKVYENNEWCWGYRETDRLGGFDPYSNSKSCSELVTESYRNSFFAKTGSAISTARAGNVIGGGDFAENRIIPDCIRAALSNQPIIVRNPSSIRPYQHVLEPVWAYIMIAEKQYMNKHLEGAYNIGPDVCDCVTTASLVEIFCDYWQNPVTVKSTAFKGPHESNCLKLDSSKIKETFGWEPRWNIQEAVRRTCDWVYAWQCGRDVVSTMDEQIYAYRGTVR